MNETRICYDTLWKLLVDKRMSKADLRRAADISPNTLTKMRNRENVSLEILKKICICLDCNIGDICEFIKEDGEPGI
jgi:DNA-binding Xre family transcriptional regulator